MYLQSNPWRIINIAFNFGLRDFWDTLYYTPVKLTNAIIISISADLRGPGDCPRPTSGPRPVSKEAHEMICYFLTR
jgi:hypothetical protein